MDYIIYNNSYNISDFVSDFGAGHLYNITNVQLSCAFLIVPLVNTGYYW